MDVTVEIDRDGTVRVTVGDESGYHPEVLDDMTRRCRETAVAVHQQVCVDGAPT